MAHMDFEGIGAGPTRVAIIEDHRLLSASLTAALQANGLSVVTPELSDLEAITAELSGRPPAVALLDLDLGAFGSGEDLLPLLLSLGTRVLLVTGVSDEAVIGRAIHAGAWGWLPKSVALEDLLEAVMRAAAGHPVLGPSERDRLVHAWREQSQRTADTLAPFERLSRRERAVLGMLREGKSVERIAAESFVSEATVRTQVRAILIKLEVNSQLEAVAKATASGWPPDG